MTVSYAKAGEFDASQISGPWVLIFGGVTRSGNRRARRSLRNAMQRGLHVVWFDGFEEKDPDTNSRIPVDTAGETEPSRLLIVGFQEAEDNTLSGRLRLGTGWRSNPIGRAIWRVFGRRLGTILRPRACWRVVQSDLEAISTLPAPEAIIYSDDSAITSAWRAGRVWKEAPIVTNLAGRGA